jgi:hypothetical protein
MLLSRCRLTLFCGLWLLATTPLWAADDSAPVADKPAGKEAAETLQPPREQTIYIPYEKLRQTFEKDGRGVFIPYERFQELWKAARAQERKPNTCSPHPAVRRRSLREPCPILSSVA